MKNSYSKILLLFVIVFFSLIISVHKIYAQDINLCRESGAVPAFIKLSSTWPVGWWYDNASYINDGDSVTNFVGVEFGTGGFPEAWATYEAVVTFASTAAIVNRIEYERYGRSDFFGGGYEKTYLWYNNQWNEIRSRSPLGAKSTEIITLGEPAYNVSKVKVKVYFKADSGNQRHRIYEIRAFGSYQLPPVYQDIGLRVYNGEAIIAIAVESLATLYSPLRIAKDGNIYGVGLVNPGDPDDSGVRIKTSSGIKALKKIESLTLINYSLGGTPSFNITAATRCSFWSTAQNINDNNEDTYVGSYCDSAGQRATAGYEAIVTFAETAPKITKVQYKSWGDNDAGVTPGSLKTYLWYNNQWNEIYSDDCFSPTITQTLYGNWLNVSKIKVSVYHSEDRSFRFFPQTKIFEIRAFGPKP